MLSLSKFFVGVLAALPALSTAYTNPVLWEDLADLDIRQYNGTYYYSASTMHYSPGAPILRSGDLVNWEYIGHSVPTLPWADKYSLINGRAYVKGIWASFFAYNAKINKWIWGGCIEFGKSYIYSAPQVTGPWTPLATFNKCYYDSGLLVDDDGTMYVSYIYNNNIWVAQLSADGKSEVKSQQVYAPPSSIGYLEGSRMYKRNGVYYILATHPANAEYTIKASSPFGSYSIKVLANSVAPPVSGAGNPHQGGIVSTPSGQWYYMAFIDNYPGGRVPVLAPVTWGSDGFPSVQLSGNSWQSSYSDPVSQVSVKPTTGTDTFSSIGPNWEWNHNPDTSKFSTGSSGLTLNTVTITTDLYAARNTITRRILGPTSTATIKLLFGSMADGDRAGLAMLRDSSAYIGVAKDNGAYTVRMVNGMTMDSNWNTVSTGSVAASASISGGTIYLRVTANIAPSGAKNALFSYSFDGTNFKSLGPAYSLNTAWEFFMGYRFAIFNFASSKLGGSVNVPSFTMVSGAASSGNGTPGTPQSGGGTTTQPNGTPADTTGSQPTTTTAPPPSGCSVTLYGQCGGIGYSGCTTCGSGKCTYSNDYYSQCL